MRVLIIILLFPLVTSAQLAFPSAVGFGKNTTGGRGGSVYHVTNLNNSGLGSLRYGMEDICTARTIVFDISGEINLNTPVRVNQNCGNITIAGQTSPDGITLKGAGLWILEGNVIVRFLKVRPGEDAYNPSGVPSTDPNYEPDDGISIKGFSNYDIENVVIDHCTVSWAHDGLIDITSPLPTSTTYTRNITVSNSFFYENVDKYYGVLINRSYNVTWYRNIITMTNDRNIAISSFEGTGVEMINNYAYHTSRSTWYREGNVNDFIGNVFETGSSTNPYEMFKMEAGTDGNDATLASIYLDDNYEDGVNDDNVYGRAVGYKVNSPNYNNGTPIIDASLVKSSLVGSSGANLFFDASDNRVINHINSGTGDLISDEDEVGGYPTVGTTSRPASYDTDNDGMADSWEMARWSTLSNGNNGDDDGDGYTNLEEFLHYMANDAGVTVPPVAEIITPKASNVMFINN